MSENMKKNAVSITDAMTIRDCIFTIRGLQVMVDWDLAALYGEENTRNESGRQPQ